MKLQIRFNWEFSFEIRALQLTWWELWKCTFKRADYMHWRLGSWRLFHFRSHCTNAQRAVSALRKLICGLIQQKCPYIQNQIICLLLDLKWFHTQLIKRPFKLKIRKVWIIPTRPWMRNKKRGLQKNLTLFDKKQLQLVWTQSFWLEITSRLGEHLETIIVITNITITIIVIIITAYKSYNGRMGTPTAPKSLVQS